WRLLLAKGNLTVTCQLARKETRRTTERRKKRKKKKKKMMRMMGLEAVEQKDSVLLLKVKMKTRKMGETKGARGSRN
ncbi:hypothetical protein TWF706_005172, partial [Orbilia oligospora]